MAVGFSLALLGATPHAGAQELSHQEAQVLRMASHRSESDRNQWIQGVRLAETLGRLNRHEALPLLIELGDTYLINSFVNEFKGPSTTPIEALIMDYRHHPILGAYVVRLAKNHHSRALFDALLADIQGELNDSRATGSRPLTDRARAALRAATSTDLAGIEPVLLQLMQGIDPVSAYPILELLSRRKYRAGEREIIDLIRRTPAGQNIGRVAALAVGWDSQAILDLLVLRLWDARSTSPADLPVRGPTGNPAENRSQQDGLARERLHEHHLGIATLVRAIRQASPRLTLDRRVLTPQALQAFSPDHRASIAEMIEYRDTQERMAREITSENFCHWATQPDRVEVIRHFISRGAPLQAKNRSQDTPLLAAVKSGNLEGARLVLQAGADPNTRDWHQEPPLHIVAKQKSFATELDERPLAMARLLIAHGADLSAHVQGMTALHAAVGRRFNSMVVLLVQSGADVNARGIELGLEGLTPTQQAMDLQDAETETFLRSQGGIVDDGFALKRAARRATERLIAPLVNGQ